MSGVVGRADVMAGLLCVLAMLLQGFIRSGSGLRLMVTVMLCMASSLSKELGVASFILCPIFELLIRRKVSDYVIEGG